MADESNKVTIKVNAGTKDAESGLSRIWQGLNKVKSAVSGVMQTLARLNWAIMAVQTIVSWFQKVHEWMNRAATAAREFANELERERIAAAAEAAADAYRKLNKELAEANRLEKERNAILDQRKGMARDLEDANLERSKQMEIAKLDTSSATYQEDKAAIERKYARRASNMSTARADEDSRMAAKRLYAEAEAKDRQADALEQKYEREWERAYDSSGRTSFARQQAARGEDGALERYKAAKAQSDKDYEAAEKTKEAMEALRKEADSIRARAAEMTGGSRAAHIRDEANQRRIDNEERNEEARKKKAEREAAEREKEQRQKEQEREAERQEREAERQERERVAAENKERTEKIGTFSRMADAMVSADAVSQNRLTAMGLGSGVSAQGSGVANDLRKIVDLLKQEIEATKQIKPSEAKFEE